MKTIYFVVFFSFLILLKGFSQQEKPEYKELKKHTAPVKALAFSDNGKMLATGGDDKSIWLWNTETGEPINNIQIYYPVKMLQFTVDDELLVASGPDVILLDLQGKRIRTFSGYTTYVWSFDYNKNTQKLTAGSYGKSIKIWDLNSGRVVQTLDGHEKSVLAVGISPDGKYIASGSLDKTIRVWDANNGAECSKVERHSGNIFAIAFHPSGRCFASASADKTIRLWNTDTGLPVKTYIGHNGSVLDVQFSPDGNFMLSCSDDKTIILWETVSGRKLYSFVDHTAPVNVVRFSPDGKYFTSGSDDKTVKIWPLEKKYFVETDYGLQIENEIANSPLFNAKSPEETKQQYAERQQKAEQFLHDLYDKYYEQYIEKLKSQSLDNLLNTK